MPLKIPGEVKDEASLAGRKTIETVKCVSATLLLCTVYPKHVCVYDIPHGNSNIVILLG